MFTRAAAPLLPLADKHIAGYDASPAMRGHQEPRLGIRRRFPAPFAARLE
jgi:hypothetical protein